eukprot:s1332_g6.t1
MSEGGLSASKIEIRGELQFAIEPKMATNQSIELHNKPLCDLGGCDTEATTVLQLHWCSFLPPNRSFASLKLALLMNYHGSLA